jgi:hypothetical protein
LFQRPLLQEIPIDAGNGCSLRPGLLELRQCLSGNRTPRAGQTLHLGQPAISQLHIIIGLSCGGAVEQEHHGLRALFDRIEPLSGQGEVGKHQHNDHCSQRHSRDHPTGAKPGQPAEPHPAQQAPAPTLRIQRCVHAHSGCTLRGRGDRRFHQPTRGRKQVAQLVIFRNFLSCHHAIDGVVQTIVK